MLEKTRGREDNIPVVITCMFYFQK